MTKDLSITDQLSTVLKANQRFNEEDLNCKQISLEGSDSKRGYEVYNIIETYYWGRLVCEKQQCSMVHRNKFS